jgi:hypothetical protein
VITRQNDEGLKYDVLMYIKDHVGPILSLDVTLSIRKTSNNLDPNTKIIECITINMTHYIIFASLRSMIALFSDLNLFCLVFITSLFLYLFATS